MARLFDRLSDQILADKTGMKRWGQKLVEQLEKSVADIQQQVLDIAEAAKTAYVINPLADVVILADSAGTIKAGQLTKTVNITASNGLGDITTLGTWARTVTAGVTCTIGASTGVLSITAMSATEQVSIPITFTYGTVSRTATVHVIKSLDTAEAANIGIAINPIADVIIYADSTGTVKTGELTRVVGLSATNGLTSITTAGTWARTVTTGVTCTMGAATGALSITALTIAEVLIPITFTYGSYVRTANVHVVRQDDPPTAAGTGGGGGAAGTTANTTTLGDTTGTAYDLTNAVSATLRVTASSAGKVKCTAPISFKRSGSSIGTSGAYGKWQWRAIAGSFADITTEVANTTDAENYVDAEGFTIKSGGQISVTMTKTGLTSSTDYEFRFVWKRVVGSGAAAEVYRAAGTMTADGTVP